MELSGVTVFEGSTCLIRFPSVAKSQVTIARIIVDPSILSTVSLYLVVVIASQNPPSLRRGVDLRRSRFRYLSIVARGKVPPSRFANSKGDRNGSNRAAAFADRWSSHLARWRQNLFLLYGRTGTRRRGLKRGETRARARAAETRRAVALKWRTRRKTNRQIHDVGADVCFSRR